MQLFSRTAKQRGAIAPMAAIIFPAMLLLAFAMLATAQWEVHREALRHGTDAIAIGNALMLEMSPVQTWTPTQLDTSSIMSYNNLTPTDTVQGGSTVLSNLPSGEGAGAYSNPQIALSTSGPKLSKLPFFSSPAVKGSTQVYFNQISALSFLPVKPRFMLMLDFSRSMRLPVTDEAAVKAHTVIQNSVEDLQGMPLALRINWGMRIFAGASTTAYAAGLTDMSIATTTLGIDPSPTGVQDPATQLSLMNVAAQSTPTLGDGTDIATAVNDVLTPMAATNDPNVGLGYLLIVTDGEPTLVQGTDLTTASYAEKIAAAEPVTTASIQQAWAEGLTTITLYIKRTNAALTAADDEAFLTSISGRESEHGDGIDFEEAASESELHDSILNKPPQLHCRTAATLKQMGVPDIRQPTVNDAVFGQMAGVNGAGSNSETPMLYCGSGDTVQIEKGNDPTGIETCMDPTDPTFDIFGTGQITNLGSARYAFYYDAPRNVFELNDWACAVYLDPVANASGLVRFRARWGMPWLLCNEGTNNCNPDPLL